MAQVVQQKLMSHNVNLVTKGQDLELSSNFFWSTDLGGKLGFKELK